MKTLDLIYFIVQALLMFAVLSVVFVASFGDFSGHCGVPGFNKINEQAIKTQIENTRGAYRSVVLTGEFLLQKW